MWKKRGVVVEGRRKGRAFTFGVFSLSLFFILDRVYSVLVRYDRDLFPLPTSRNTTQHSHYHFPTDPTYLHKQAACITTNQKKKKMQDTGTGRRDGCEKKRRGSSWVEPHNAAAADDDNDAFAKNLFTNRVGNGRGPWAEIDLTKLPEKK